MKDSRDNFEILDELQRRQKKRMFSFSPNDALVQISLPLVLILAIATRLMIVSQSLSDQDRGPVILDLWKQQLILRIERVLEEWEDSAELAAFPDFERIQWGEGWPKDKRFSRLCDQALGLNAIAGLQTNIYQRALRYRMADGEDSGATAVLYDPQSALVPEQADRIPEQFRIDAERRQYAFDYIRKRCLQWREHIEGLQWGVVARCAAELPLSDDLADAEIALQAQKLAAGLSERGYPLLESITGEYGSE